MGKKKASKKKGQNDDDGSGSIGTASTLSTVKDLGYDEEDVAQDDPFEQSIDALYEKRASTREKGLQNLVRMLAASFCCEEATVRKDTLTTLMLGCIKKGSALEATLACRGIALLLVTLGAGADAESLQQESQPVFEQAACYGKAVTVKAAAIEALAISAFVASENPSSVDKCMTGFGNLWKAGPSVVSAAAVRGWALLLSTVPPHRLTSGSIEASLQSLAKLLHSSEVDVRAAAGEAIALLYHSCGLSNLDAFLESEHNQLEQDDSASDSEQDINYYNELVTQPLSSHSEALLEAGDSPGQEQASADGRSPVSVQPSEAQTSAAQSSATQGSATQNSATQSSAASPSHPQPDATHGRSGFTMNGGAVDQHGSESWPQPNHSQEPQLESAPTITAHSVGPSSSSSSDPSTASLKMLEHAATELGSRPADDSTGVTQQLHQLQVISSNGNSTGPAVATARAEPPPAAQAASSSDSSIEPAVATARAAHPIEPQTCHQLPAAPDKPSKAGIAKIGKHAKSDKGAQQSPAKSGRDLQQQAEALSNGLDDVVSRMKDLAKNKGDSTRRSRRDRALLRGTFRELCSVVEEGGDVPQIKIKLQHGDSLVVGTLSGTVQLNAMRRFLAEGFQAHLQHNPLLHQIFGFAPRAEKRDRLTPLEKRMYRSPASAESKSRTQQRNHDRAAASAYKGAMMAGGW